MSRRLFGAVLAVCFLSGLTSFAQDKAVEKKTTSIKILLPETLHKPAEVKIEDTVTKQTGAERQFVTPPLEAGKKYTYKITAIIDPNNYTTITRVKDVEFKAGEELTIDLRAKDPTDRIKIRWVPTPKDIAKKMGELAKIGKDDVVYDLGCGDAIMIITAVKENGAKRGVGIDIDEKKVAEAKEAAVAAGIKDKIEIRKGDILDVADISDASVVMLYLADEMNLRLRPMLQKSLKPGSRIVSHRFIMGDWKPDETVTVKGEDGDEYTLHVWTVQAPGKDTPKK